MAGHLLRHADGRATHLRPGKGAVAQGLPVVAVEGGFVRGAGAVHEAWGDGAGGAGAVGAFEGLLVLRV